MYFASTRSAANALCLVHVPSFFCACVAPEAAAAGASSPSCDGAADPSLSSPERANEPGLDVSPVALDRPRIEEPHKGQGTHYLPFDLDSVDSWAVLRESRLRRRSASKVRTALAGSPPNASATAFSTLYHLAEQQSCLQPPDVWLRYSEAIGAITRYTEGDLPARVGYCFVVGLQGIVILRWRPGG